MRVVTWCSPCWLSRFGNRSFCDDLGTGRIATSRRWNLAGAAGHHAVDALTAALSLPVATEPHRVGFAPDSQWRGETHPFV